MKGDMRQHGVSGGHQQLFILLNFEQDFQKQIRNFIVNDVVKRIPKPALMNKTVMFNAFNQRAIGDQRIAPLLVRSNADDRRDVRRAFETQRFQIVKHVFDIAESLFADGKRAIRILNVNINMNSIYRYFMGAIGSGDRHDLLFRIIAITPLMIDERIARLHLRAPRERRKLSKNVLTGFPQKEKVIEIIIERAEIISIIHVIAFIRSIPMGAIPHIHECLGGIIQK